MRKWDIRVWGISKFALMEEFDRQRGGFLGQLQGDKRETGIEPNRSVDFGLM